MNALSLIVLVVAVVAVRATPPPGYKLMYGDVLVKEGDVDAKSRNVWNEAQNKYWPGGKVYWKFADPRYTEEHKNLVRQALKNIESKTCLRFYENQPVKNYIEIKSLDGCYSMCGYLNNGPQIMSLNIDGCMIQSTITHEFLHAVGFHHEHGRWDRDKYINVNVDMATDKDAFDKQSKFLTTQTRPFNYDR